MNDCLSVSEFYKKFPGENTCRSYIAQLRWGSEPVCPRCGGAKDWQINGFITIRYIMSYYLILYPQLSSAAHSAQPDEEPRSEHALRQCKDCTVRSHDPSSHLRVIDARYHARRSDDSRE